MIFNSLCNFKWSPRKSRNEKFGQENAPLGHFLQEAINEASVQFLDLFAKLCHSLDFSVSNCGLSTLAFYAMLSKEGLSSSEHEPWVRRTETRDPRATQSVRESDNSNKPLAACRRAITATETTFVASHKNISQFNIIVKPKTIQLRMH